MFTIHLSPPSLHRVCVLINDISSLPIVVLFLATPSIQVGCNNEMFPTGKLIASQIGEQMNEGLIDDITDLSFDWWLVWAQRINSR